jgi:hypothetical protein
MATKNQSPWRIPDLDASDMEILEFFKRYFNKMSIYRSRSMDRPAMSIYYHLGRQWIERDSRILVDGVRGFSFKDIDQPEGATLPRPVTNIITGSVEMEVSALGRRELTAIVVTTSKDPRLEEATKAAQEILEARLAANNWPELREFVTLLTIVTGTGCLKSYWDETWEDTTMKPKTQTAMCQECGYVIAEPEVGLVKGQELGIFDPMATPEQISEVHPPSPDPNPTEAKFVLSVCPHCGGQLAPFPVDEGLAQNGMDSYNQPLGQERPKGNTAMEVVTVFDLYPENSGVNSEPHNAKVWGQCTPRSIDWICARYPEYKDRIEPDDPVEIMRWHPLLGEWSLLGRYDHGLDSGIFEDYALVHELTVDKNHRFPEGRRIVTVGDVVLYNGPLYRTVDSPQGPVSVPLVKYAAARWKTRVGEFWGQSLVDDLISPQNRLNGIDAQIVEARERMGSPNLLASEAMELEGPEYRDQYGLGKVMRYKADPLSPGAKPEVFQGQTMPGEVYQERDRILADMKMIAGPQDIELGEAPKNITTTSGLQLLGERAEARRGPRERSLIEMYEKIWKHQLELIWALRDTSDVYEIQNKDGSYEEKMFDRTVIMGQTKVKIEKQAYVDKSLVQKEATREAMADGLIVADSQVARKKILELRGLPTNINEDLNRQVDLAKQQWVEFADEGIVPVVDTLLDDMAIHFQVLAEMVTSEEGKKLQKALDWPGTTKLISGWEEQLGQMEMVDAQTVAFYGGRLDPEQGAQAYAQAMVNFDQQMDSYEQTSALGQQAAEATGMAPPMAPPPQQPPPPIFLPPDKATRIYMIWSNMILRGMQQQQPSPMPGEGDVMADPAQDAMMKDQFLQFMSVVAAYKLLAEERALQMTMGMPGMPAPGAPGGPAGGGMAPGGNAGGMPQPPTPPGPPQSMNMAGSNPGVG